MSDIKKIDTFALIDELSNRTKWELEFGLLTLLKNRKIDYKSISEMYVKALEEWNKDEKNKLIDAMECVLDQMIYHKQKDDSVIQRCLYLLNKSNSFQMEKLNKKYNYNEEEGRKLSWYEKNKNRELI